jgi:hypothetical protein
MPARAAAAAASNEQKVCPYKGEKEQSFFRKREENTYM